MLVASSAGDPNVPCTPLEVGSLSEDSLSTKRQQCLEAALARHSGSMSVAVGSRTGVETAATLDAACVDGRSPRHGDPMSECSFTNADSTEPDTFVSTSMSLSRQDFAAEVELCDTLKCMGFQETQITKVLSKMEASIPSYKSLPCEERIRVVLDVLMIDDADDGFEAARVDQPHWLQEDILDSSAVAEGPSCPICFDTIVPDAFVSLGCGHVFCRGCLQGHLGAVALPVCPDLTCSYELVEADVADVCGYGSQRHTTFQEMLLQRAVDVMKGRVSCPNPACRNVAFVDSTSLRQRFTCGCGWAPWCTQCRQEWHSHGDCNEMGALRERWLEWVTNGRSAYHGQVDENLRASRDHIERLTYALARQREEEGDEEWKGANCRCCPSCGRPAQKLAGCNSMICGRNYHGGDQQDGCGATWDWARARAYQPRVNRRELPKIDQGRLKSTGVEVRHLFVSCDVCGAPNIKGPRLKCLQCESFNVCVACDRASAVGCDRIVEGGSHPSDHTFQIIFLPQTSYNEDIPIGVKVRLWGLTGRNVHLNGALATVLRYFPPGCLRQGPLYLQPAYELRMPEDVLGSKVRTFSAACVQLGCEDYDTLSSQVEAMLAQADARKLHYNLPEQQLVQLIGYSGSEFYEGQLARIVSQSDDGARGPCYTVGVLDECESGSSHADCPSNEAGFGAAATFLMGVVDVVPTAQPTNPSEEHSEEQENCGARRKLSPLVRSVEAYVVQPILAQPGDLVDLEKLNYEYLSRSTTSRDCVKVACAFCDETIEGFVVWERGKAYHFGCRKV